MTDVPDDIRQAVAGNIAQWTRSNRGHTDGRAADEWASEVITWACSACPRRASARRWVPEAARLLRRHGFDVEDLIELQVPSTARTHEYYDFVSAEWARKWPAEEIWVARLRD